MTHDQDGNSHTIVDEDFSRAFFFTLALLIQLFFEFHRFTMAKSEEVGISPPRWPHGIRILRTISQSSGESRRHTQKYSRRLRMCANRHGESPYKALCGYLYDIYNLFVLIFLFVIQLH